ncbi:hypothetical protein CO110_04485 [Candidatus Desantisbacteria bacterium CG_4_9_14_3_um_filter_40_11]|uniref:Polymerase nucleotidyl transferase domain-containing protein n=5 Tax=unclassified Candidatus Desantisiibacteriota TaxID=3106372 RepID=A0A2M7JC44_9BACT|nr:MAG: DNA polymerase III subunit beta [Candidatus Desantisbacteria bacterium CG23_combo_of_CG06-09_8_20_14_all_40_23]PIX16954.1 MAG: hypothetical protein COZ71_05825 [Candidatus Desantisbacteria bacterium CG_4_8_14_3_um_filter_40_12]PIY18616.1 MAG: hypothetical protein COZ13_09690 [Candidatus Desantisbacteria bacterium CG_4_10_14_3_um_filter_40_18]PJB29682.1 MAG: hypothetical protein CO110_04485 [Candidatus Desantisbacteria bacterium CG_4_9_14_3_um_filter_40_11]
MVTMMREINEEVIRDIRDKIINHFHPEMVILFGSYASGNPKKGSDLDLLVVRDSDIPRHKRSIPIRRLFRGYMIPMDIIVYTPSEVERDKNIMGSFIHDILSRGRKLYG